MAKHILTAFLVFMLSGGPSALVSSPWSDACAGDSMAIGMRSHDQIPEKQVQGNEGEPAPQPTEPPDISC